MKELILSIFDYLNQLGYWGIALGLMIEIIPSEIVLSYGGYLVSLGHINFFGAILAGTIGITIAQVLLYWIGLFGGRPFLDKYGKFLLIHKRHIDASEYWFQKYGPIVVFTARFIPVVRQAVSIPAGISKMPLSKFIAYTVGATIPWTVLFLLLGMQLGTHWKDIEEYARPYVLPITIIAIIFIALYFFWQKRKRKK
ncbi:DedA family protein [Cytobacillus sp. Hz8]|uniref:DedA family protein n=1 Tax=Cytobacillus sp. Hz8 TaxID=3347168 RepID=UPI0035DA3479